MKESIHLLFSYGTIQLEKVQLENYGRILKGEADTLPGYRLDQLRITNDSVLSKSVQEYHPIAVKSFGYSDFVEGKIFELTTSELVETDKYEVSEYKRVLETFESGKKAWVYVAKTMTL